MVYHMVEVMIVDNYMGVETVTIECINYSTQFTEVMTIDEYEGTEVVTIDIRAVDPRMRGDGFNAEEFLLRSQIAEFLLKVQDAQKVKETEADASVVNGEVQEHEIKEGVVIGFDNALDEVQQKIAKEGFHMKEHHVFDEMPSSEMKPMCMDEMVEPSSEMLNVEKLLEIKVKGRDVLGVASLQLPTQVLDPRKFKVTLKCLLSNQNPKVSSLNSEDAMWEPGGHRIDKGTYDTTTAKISYDADEEEYIQNFAVEINAPEFSDLFGIVYDGFDKITSLRPFPNIGVSVENMLNLLIGGSKKYRTGEDCLGVLMSNKTWEPVHHERAYIIFKGERGDITIATGDVRCNKFMNCNLAHVIWLGDRVTWNVMKSSYNQLGSCDVAMKLRKNLDSSAAVSRLATSGYDGLREAIKLLNVKKRVLDFVDSNVDMNLNMDMGTYYVFFNAWDMLGGTKKFLQLCDEIFKFDSKPDALYNEMIKLCVGAERKIALVLVFDKIIGKWLVISVFADDRGPNFAILLGGVPWPVIIASRTVVHWFYGELTLVNGAGMMGWAMFPARTTFRYLSLAYNKTSYQTSCILSGRTKIVETISFDVLVVPEPIQLGPWIIKIHLNSSNKKGKWKTSSTIVGYNWWLLFLSIKAGYLWLYIEEEPLDVLLVGVGYLLDGEKRGTQVGITTSGDNFIFSRIMQTANLNDWHAKDDALSYS